MNDVLYPDIEVQLSGEDGNAFLIIARVTRAITDVAGRDAASVFMQEALDSQSYEDLLRYVMKTVNVK